MDINNLRKREDGAYEFDIMIFGTEADVLIDVISFNEALDILKARLPVYGEFRKSWVKLIGNTKIDHENVSHQIIDVINYGNKVTIVFEPVASSRGETLRLILSGDLQAPDFSFFFRSLSRKEGGMYIFDKLITADFIKVCGSKDF